MYQHMFIHIYIYVNIYIHISYIHTPWLSLLALLQLSESLLFRVFVRSLIFHYVTEHDYLPSKSFIDAVCYGVDPNSYEYHRLLGELA